MLCCLVGMTSCVKFPDPPPDWPGGDFIIPVMLERARGAPVEPDEGEDGVFVPTRISYSLRDTKDFIASLSVTKPESDGDTAKSMSVKWRRGGEWAIESTGPDGVVRYVGKGGLGFEVKDGQVIREGVTAEEVGIERLLRSLFILDFFESSTGTSSSVERVEERSDGGYAILLSKWDDAGMKWTLYLDSVTCTPMRVREWIWVSEDEARPLDTFLSDFGPDREGHLVPRVLRTYSGQALVQETRIRDVDWNQGLSEKDFRP